METERKDDSALNGQVDRQSNEREPDQAHCPLLALPGDVGEFPEHDRRGTDLDETVESESRQRHGARLDSRHRKHENAHHIPFERGGLQQASSPQQRTVLLFGGWTRHQVSVSGSDPGKLRHEARMAIDDGQPPSARHRLNFGGKSVFSHHQGGSRFRNPWTSASSTDCAL